MRKNNYVILSYNLVKQNIFILKLIIGIIFFYYIIWRKFLRIRLPKSIDDVLEINHIFIYMNIILFSLTCIFNLIYLLKQNKDKASFIMRYIKNIPYIYKILDIVIWLFDNIFSSPKVVYRFIVDKTKVSRIIEPIFSFIGAYCDNYYNHKNKNIYEIIYICFNSLPKLVIVLIFLVEIIFYHQLHFFYKSLFLYLIPFLYNILYFMVDYMCNETLAYCNAHIIVEKINGEEVIQFRTEMPNIPQAVDIVKRRSETKLLKWFLDLYDVHDTIKTLMYNLAEARTFVKSYETILISGLYLISWIYVLFYSWSL